MLELSLKLPVSHRAQGHRTKEVGRKAEMFQSTEMNGPNK
jgi:hypothetical protein